MIHLDSRVSCVFGASLHVGALNYSSVLSAAKSILSRALFADRYCR